LYLSLAIGLFGLRPLALFLGESLLLRGLRGCLQPPLRRFLRSLRRRLGRALAGRSCLCPRFGLLGRLGLGCLFFRERPGPRLFLGAFLLEPLLLPLLFVRLGRGLLLLRQPLGFSACLLPL